MLNTAVLGQGVLFGLMHSYQGWEQVIVISALGVLYGALAAWRRNLRANIIAHAWSDVWEGWLKQLIWT
jgi:membrane protease YdiL (CAAX protease family)